MKMYGVLYGPFDGHMTLLGWLDHVIAQRAAQSQLFRMIRAIAMARAVQLHAGRLQSMAVARLQV